MNTSKTITTVSEATDKAVTGLAQAVSEAGHLLQELGASKVSSARAALDQGRAALADSAGACGAAADASVQAHPWRAIAVAGLAGLVVGALLARR